MTRQEAAEEYALRETAGAWPDYRIALDNYLAGWEECERQRWISVETVLPEKDTPVLVFNGKGTEIDEWCDIYETPVSFSSATICVGEGWASNTEVTHWQPLPPPPSRELESKE